MPIEYVLAAKVFDTTLVLTTELVFSSDVAFKDVCFVILCALVFCFKQSLKSRSVALAMFVDRKE